MQISCAPRLRETAYRDFTCHIKRPNNLKNGTFRAVPFHYHKQQSSISLSVILRSTSKIVLYEKYGASNFLKAILLKVRSCNSFQFERNRIFDKRSFRTSRAFYRVSFPRRSSREANHFVVLQMRGVYYQTAVAVASSKMTIRWSPQAMAPA